MNKEKSLIKIEEKNVIEKLSEFIKKLFLKKQKPNLNNNVTSEKQNDFINKIKEDRKLFDMQKDFESGKLKEEDLAETEKENLIKLYNKQIDSLKQDIENYNRILKSYKEKILVAKNKLKNNWQIQNKYDKI